MDNVSQDRKIRDAATAMALTDQFQQTGFCGVSFQDRYYLALYDSKQFTIIPWKLYKELLANIPAPDSDIIQ